ncbi:MAG: hypothetical protein ACE5E1_08130 [Phycisphaerae bacterium]
MKFLPFLFIAGAVLSWGAYVPTIHAGQLGFGAHRGPFRAFLFVGLAYFLVGVLIPGVLIFVLKQEPRSFPVQGVKLSTLAGVFGAIGALCVIFALWSGGRPIYVAPLVFAGAPIMNVAISLKWNPPAQPAQWPFYLGLLLAAGGAALVLTYKPT